MTSPLNQQAFDEGFRSSLVRRGLIKSAEEEIPDPLWHPFAYVGRQISDAAGAAKPAAIATGVGVPLLAAAWYWHNKREAEKEALGKTATWGGYLGALGGAAAVGFPIFGAVGAYQLAEYLKNRQEAAPVPDLDTILNVNPKGEFVTTQEEKKKPLL